MQRLVADKRGRRRIPVAGNPSPSRHLLIVRCERLLGKEKHCTAGEHRNSDTSLLPAEFAGERFIDLSAKTKEGRAGSATERGTLVAFPSSVACCGFYFFLVAGFFVSAFFSAGFFAVSFLVVAVAMVAIPPDCSEVTAVTANV